jgi:alpha-tubulin suppressor-like RCC1 family protein
VVDGGSERPLGSDGGAEALDTLAADGGGPVAPVPRRRLSAGGQLACALGSDGSAWCWGLDAAAVEQGITDSAAPVAITRGGTAAIDIAVNEGQVCLLKSDGSIFCAGYLGEDAILQGIGGRVTAIAACGTSGRVFGCAVRADGAVFCWSGTEPSDNPLGNTTTSWTPARAPGLDGAVDIACGGSVACALRSDGTLWCWGGGAGNVMPTSTIGVTQETPRMVPELGTDVTAAFAGAGGVCVSTSGGDVQCWGSLFDPSLNKQFPGHPSFQATPKLTGARRIAIGDAHACAIQADGSLACFGANDFGQLGDGTFVAHDAPAPVVGLGGPVTEVVAGIQATCALLASGGGIRCFGNNDHGTLGDGSALGLRASPVDLGGSAVLSHHAHHQGLGSAVLTDGTVEIWGRGASSLIQGAPLRAARPIALTTPATAPLAHKATVNGSGACLLTSDGAVTCLRSMFAPGAMLPLGVVSGFSTGVTDLIGACAVRGDGVGTCGLPAGLTTSGVLASDQGMFQKLAIGWFDGGCGLLRDGRIDCWANILAVAAEPVELGGAAIDLSVFDSACAVRSDGAVLCWDVGGSSSAVTPELVPLPASSVGVSVGLGYACAWTADGQLFCWGQNQYGQLGDGTIAPRNAPVKATVVPGPVRVASAGWQQTCVELATDGSLWCWGWNGAGELGDGKGGPRAVPVPVAVP